MESVVLPHPLPIERRRGRNEVYRYSANGIEPTRSRSLHVRPNLALGLIGAGNMAEALLRGALAAQRVAPDRVTFCDPIPVRQVLFQQQLGARMASDIAGVAQAAQMIILCVKPQQCAGVLVELKPHFQVERHVLISILAGVRTERIEAALPPGARIIRVMPNTPMLVGVGASGLCAGSCATESDLAEAEQLFSCASVVVRVKEASMDAVTGLSGSGPAYLFYLVEAMVEAGVQEGLAREDALRLAVRTCRGAAQMLEETGAAPEELRRRVTSPNGTTQAACEVLDNCAVKKTLVSAVRRAAERSRELGRA
jgi:pyrroline-5-carboxylate reductase